MSASPKLSLVKATERPVEAIGLEQRIDIYSGLRFQNALGEIRAKQSVYYKFKIVGETAAAALLLLIMAVPMLIIASIILVFMGRPFLYKQKRVGKNGVPFWAYKFRTMKNGAPRVVEMGYAALAKVSDDPRVAGRLGNFLRKWKWDELPQLFNVIKGDMLLIGPRPYLYEENFVFVSKYYARFAVRPGLSGLWQACKLHVNNPKVKLRLDDYYARHVSLRMDLWIWLNTFYVMVVGEKFDHAHAKHPHGSESNGKVIRTG